ncbi:A-kinase anchor protein 14 [Channa argus]|uniref:A-kinase anchor protein 14 n=1 Tax=Channa argus TaxID=215402 RepID=UPI00294770F6|nr:hypothetical protein Q8A73_022063 [Channa argus]
MGEHRPSSNLNYTTESAHLIKTLQERHRYTVTKEQQSPGSDRSNMNINWVASKDFTVEMGKKQIREYIQTWEMQPSWLYSLDFLYTTEEDYFTCHHYRARFSTPTPQKPIQGTASVFFVVGISKVKPQTLPVEVLFVLESNRLVHTPGQTRFKEKWLADIIESKRLLGRAVNL